MGTETARTTLAADGGLLVCLPELLRHTPEAAIEMWLSNWDELEPLPTTDVTVLHVEATLVTTPLGAVHHRVLHLGRVVWGASPTVDWNGFAGEVD